MGVQENASFIEDSLPNRKNLFSDDNDSWKMKGAGSKFLRVQKEGG